MTDPPHPDAQSPGPREAGLARLKAGDAAGAVELLRQAAIAAPADHRLLLSLGVALQRAARHEEAIAVFQRAEAAQPNDAAAPLHAALSALSLGQTLEAAGAAERACRLAPDLAPAHVMRGRVRMAQGEAAEAARSFAEALRLAPDSAETWRLCARARRQAGDVSGAVAALREAVRLAPDFAPAKAELAQCEAEAAGLNAWRPTSPAAALGLSVEYLGQKPAFAALPFGEWSQVLFYQVARGHYLFVVDGGQRIRGFLGWALTEQAFAEEWVAGRAGLRNESGEEGDCVIVNAWAAEDARANRFLRAAVARLFADRHAVYYKRHYPDGRERPMRLIVPAHRRKPRA